MKPRAFQENRDMTTLCIRTAEVTFKSLNTVYDEALFRLCLFIYLFIYLFLINRKSVLLYQVN